MIEGIIPEIKRSESDKNIKELLKLIEPYPIISINTSSLFDGDISDIKAVRCCYENKFIIRKDFLMIPRHIEESKKAGADAVLLIDSFLRDKQLDVLVTACNKNDIIPIIEIDSFFRYVYLDKIRVNTVIINSRNLNTLDSDKELTIRLCKHYKSRDYNVIYASGEKSDRMVRDGISDAVLIGSAFMKGDLK